MDGEFEIPRRMDGELPPWRWELLGQYVIAHYNDGQPLDGEATNESQEPAEEQPERPAAQPMPETAPMPPATEAQGDPLIGRKNFDPIFTRYRDEIYGFILHMVHNVETAQDLEQDAFIRAYVAVSRSKPAQVHASRARAWLYRIAYNTSVDYLRRGHIIGFEPLPPNEVTDTGGAGVDILTSKEPPFDEQLAEMDLMQETLKRLRPAESAVLLLSAVYGLSNEEIAEIFNSTPSGVRMRIRRARAKANKIAQKLTDEQLPE